MYMRRFSSSVSNILLNIIQYTAKKNNIKTKIKEKKKLIEKTYMYFLMHRSWEYVAVYRWDFLLNQNVSELSPTMQNQECQTKHKYNIYM